MEGGRGCAGRGQRAQAVGFGHLAAGGWLGCPPPSLAAGPVCGAKMLQR